MSKREKEKFGRAMRKAREGLGLTQRQVAKQIRCVQPMVCLWEKGVHFPNPHYQERIAKVLGVVA